MKNPPQVVRAKTSMLELLGSLRASRKYWSASSAIRTPRQCVVFVHNTSGSKEEGRREHREGCAAPWSDFRPSPTKEGASVNALHIRQDYSAECLQNTPPLLAAVCQPGMWVASHPFVQQSLRCGPIPWTSSQQARYVFLLDGSQAAGWVEMRAGGRGEWGARLHNVIH